MNATLYKAESTTEPVPDLRLEATVTVPSFPASGDWAHDIRVRRAMYLEQAKIVVDALMASLPGGTVDAILGELLAAKGFV